MCDGVTQGEPGMELSLFSRDVIALATAVALSHDMFDAALCLGVCDKIVPGLLIGALPFGHLPTMFVPAGPMPSGLSNDEKAKIRQLYAEGKVEPRRAAASRGAAYHAPGTCTFYGTANTNQMLMEIMGLHLPGAAFVNPNTPLRDALTEAARSGRSSSPRRQPRTRRSATSSTSARSSTASSACWRPAARPITRSTWSRWRAAAGITLTWDDFADLSEVVPLLARIYPNGKADVNHFHAAGGMALPDPRAARRRPAARRRADGLGRGLADYPQEPRLGLDGAARPGATAPEEVGDDRPCCAASTSRSRRRRPALLDGQPRPRRDQDLGGDAGAPR